MMLPTLQKAECARRVEGDAPPTCRACGGENLSGACCCYKCFMGGEVDCSAMEEGPPQLTQAVDLAPAVEIDGNSRGGSLGLLAEAAARCWLNSVQETVHQVPDRAGNAGTALLRPQPSVYIIPSRTTAFAQDLDKAQSAKPANSQLCCRLPCPPAPDEAATVPEEAATPFVRVDERPSCCPQPVNARSECCPQPVNARSGCCPQPVNTGSSCCTQPVNAHSGCCPQPVNTGSSCYSQPVNAGCPQPGKRSCTQQPAERPPSPATRSQPKERACQPAPDHISVGGQEGCPQPAAHTRQSAEESLPDATCEMWQQPPSDVFRHLMNPSPAELLAWAQNGPSWAPYLASLYAVTAMSGKGGFQPLSDASRSCPPDLSKEQIQAGYAAAALSLAASAQLPASQRATSLPTEQVLTRPTATWGAEPLQFHRVLPEMQNLAELHGHEPHSGPGGQTSQLHSGNTDARLPDAYRTLISKPYAGPGGPMSTASPPSAFRTLTTLQRNAPKPSAGEILTPAQYGDRPPQSLPYGGSGDSAQGAGLQINCYPPARLSADDILPGCSPQHGADLQHSYRHQSDSRAQSMAQPGINTPSMPHGDESYGTLRQKGQHGCGAGEQYGIVQQGNQPGFEAGIHQRQQPGPVPRIVVRGDADAQSIVPQKKRSRVYVREGFATENGIQHADGGSSQLRDSLAAGLGKDNLAITVGAPEKDSLAGAKGTRASSAESSETTLGAGVSSQPQRAAEGGPELGSMATKTCTRCHKTLLVANFCKNRRSPDGLFTQCRACVAIKDKARHAKILAQPKAPAGAKVCSRCRECKPQGDFYLDAGRPDGLQTYCKACYAEKYREKKRLKSMQKEAAV